jgi:hypothetical protein
MIAYARANIFPFENIECYNFTTHSLQLFNFLDIVHRPVFYLKQRFGD